jgi:DNA-binding response OmpR family regulator
MEPQVAQPPRGPRARVLIVDDDPDIRESTAMLLSLHGFEVRTHGQAEDILERIGAERPDVVLQDVMMPGLDLRGLMRRLRTHAALRGVPIVLFSASVDVEAKAREVGADGGVAKPFEVQTLVRALERFARRSGS